MSDTPGDVMDLDAPTWERLRRLHLTVTRQLTTDLQARCGISLTTYEILDGIEHGARNRLQDLLADIPVSQPTLSRRVEKLEDEHLLKRQPDPQDRRATVLTLTSLGRDTLARATPVHRSALHTALHPAP